MSGDKIQQNVVIADTAVDWGAEADLPRYRAALALLESDKAAALAELERMAEGGSVRSMVELGWQYSHGERVRHDLIIAESWYLRAIYAGATDATYHLGELLSSLGEFQKASEIFEIGARKEFTPSMNRLGILYFCGEGVDRDKVKAKALWQRASLLGNIVARRHLAFASLKGTFGAAEIPHGIWLLLSTIRGFWEVVRRAGLESDLLRE